MKTVPGIRSKPSPFQTVNFDEGLLCTDLPKGLKVQQHVDPKEGKALTMIGNLQETEAVICVVVDWMPAMKDVSIIKQRGRHIISQEAQQHQTHLMELGQSCYYTGQQEHDGEGLKKSIRYWRVGFENYFLSIQVIAVDSEKGQQGADQLIPLIEPAIQQLRFASLASPMHPCRFTDLCVERFIREFSTMHVIPVGPLHLHLKPVGRDLDNPNGANNTFHLGNLYDSYRSAPGQIDKLFQRVIPALRESVAAIDGIESLMKVNPERVIPVVKHRNYVRQTEEKTQAKTYYEPYNSELVRLYAEDRPNTLTYLSPDMIKDLNLPPKALYEIAQANLSKVIPTIRVDKTNGIFTLSTEGNYEASLIFLDSIWNGSKLIDVKGEKIVAIPSRDMLMVTGSANQQAVEAMRFVAKMMHDKSAYAISPLLFVYRNGKFEIYHSPNEKLM